MRFTVLASALFICDAIRNTTTSPYSPKVTKVVVFILLIAAFMDIVEFINEIAG